MKGASRWMGVGRAGEPYPDAVRALEGDSGVYAIRSKATRMVLYVGESHTGRLRRTLTRHLQGWGRDKGLWRGQFSAHDPGLIYPRDKVEVRWWLTEASQAYETQNRLIRRLSPRDNIAGNDHARGVDFIPDLPF